MAGLLVVALCIPEAFGDRALTFAVAYCIVRLGHVSLFLIASMHKPALRRSVLMFACNAAIAVGLLVGASFADGWVQTALVTERRLLRATEGRERNKLARDSYSYLHLPMVAGIVLGAFGLEATLAHAHEPLDGTAIYLLAHVALRWRNAHTIDRERLGLALVLFALIPARCTWMRSSPS